MKIIFFGTPEFAATHLASLAKESDIEIEAVVTQPDKPTGRKQVLTPPPVKELAQNLNIEILQPANKKELLSELKKYKVDFYTVVAYGLIFPQEALDLPEYGAINVHPSLLPKYRGATPIQESILHGDEETGVSIIKMNSKMDEGDILLIKRVHIGPNEDAETLAQRLAIISSQMLPHVLRDAEASNLNPLPQNPAKASYCRKIEREDGKIDFKKSASEIKNMLRAYTPWPGIYTELDGKKLKILALEISEEKNEPGKFIFGKKDLKIGAGEGTILPKTVQPEGKKPMDIASFVNGYKK